MKICHCEDIIETEGNNSTDLIMINPNGEKVAVEIKDRSWGGKTSKMFGDHLIEKTKLQSLYNRKQNGEFDRLFLVSLFIDGVIVLTKDLENNILRQGIMKMPRTSTLDNHDLIDKECIFYNQDIKLYFYFEKDRINQNKYSVIFSNDPVDLFKLNNKYNIDKDGQMKLELF